MAKKKWTIEKYIAIDEYGKSELSYLLSFGSVEYPGETIDELSIGELIRLEKLLRIYVLKEQREQV